jgi:hypothetical protein
LRVITELGLNAKIPFNDSVVYNNERILNMESPVQSAFDPKRTFAAEVCCDAQQAD